MQTKVDLVLNAQATLGEGPIWDDEAQLLYWVDIINGHLHAYNPATDKDVVYDVGHQIGTVVPRQSGGVILALENGFAAYNLETKILTPINDPEADLPDNRFNDGKCDPAGRLWAGTMLRTAEGTQGSLYCLDTDLSVRKVFGKVGVSNGIAWSPDNKSMYYIDTPTQVVRAYDYELESGNISNERVVIQVPPEMGFPDGMTIDEEGMLWIAHWDGKRVCRWSPETGEVLQSIEMPVSRATACAFGGKDLDSLYITSAAVDLSEAQLKQEPLAGGLFVIKPGVKGVKAFNFKG